MQCDTTALQIMYCKSHTVKGETADCIGLSLTLPKSYLATFNFMALTFIYIFQVVVVG